jgi:hypothetical protein
MPAAWLRRLTLATVVTLLAWLALGAAPAEAQVFRPRGRAAALAKAPAKKNGQAAKPAAAISKSPTRAPGTTPHRVGTTKPSKKSRAGSKARHDADDVVVHDDDDDVKITDDN